MGKGFYGVRNHRDLSFGASSITICQAGSPITCVHQKCNMTSAGIIGTQNGDGAILWAGHCKVSLINIQKVLGSHLLNRLTSEKSGSFIPKWVGSDEIPSRLWQMQSPPFHQLWQHGGVLPGRTREMVASPAIDSSPLSFQFYILFINLLFLLFFFQYSYSI